MSWMTCRTFGFGLAVVLAALAAQARAQVYPWGARALASNVIIPQARVFAGGGVGQVEITGVNVGVVILEQAATTTMDVSLRNPTNVRLQSELLVPVPDGAVVRGFAFQGSSPEAKAELMPKEEAQRTYDAIVAKIRDPGLVEFVGYNLIRSCVFPVEARGTQTVRLTYEHILPADGDRIDYVLPRTESLDYKVPWKVSVLIKSKSAISTVYSPSHRLETARAAANRVSVRIAEGEERAGTAPNATEPGPFRLSYLIERRGVTASLYSYPDPTVGGGYFLLLAGLPAKDEREAGGPALKREVTLLLDHSGSMSGGKIEQVRHAALQIVAGLEEGETFNLILFNDAVDLYSAAPVLKTSESVDKAGAYIRTIRAQGGTNIHDALLEALRQRPTPGMIPIVLFLTDGCPTVGQTSEVAIREVAAKANPANRRIFTFGVGVDVNTPLLEKIACETRGTPTFVLPKEDIEVKVSQVFKRLVGPVLAAPDIQVVGGNKRPAPGRVRDLLPARLPDLFEGDQLVLLGQYVGEEPLSFVLQGNYLGRERTFQFSFDLTKATTRNGFVPRLWASRKIALLVDAIRDMGADIGPRRFPSASVNDPRFTELVDEIVSLSTKFGILTEYTAFLATEGTDLSRRDQVLAQAAENFQNRAMAVRSGWGSMNQSLNNSFQRGQDVLNVRNNFFDQNMNRVAVSNVQQIGDLAFYRQGGRWVDSRAVKPEGVGQPKKVIEFGTEEFRQLAHRLAAEGRQGSISLQGDIVVVVDGEPVLVKGPAAK